MRITITLDEDVAIELKKPCADRGLRLEAVVNDALRAGLRALRDSGDGGASEYRTRSVSLGRPTYPDLDNVAELLAVAEGDEYL